MGPAHEHDNWFEGQGGVRPRRLHFLGGGWLPGAQALLSSSLMPGLQKQIRRAL